MSRSAPVTTALPSNSIQFALFAGVQPPVRWRSRYPLGSEWSGFGSSTRKFEYPVSSSMLDSSVRGNQTIDCRVKLRWRLPVRVYAPHIPNGLAHGPVRQRQLDFLRRCDRLPSTADPNLPAAAAPARDLMHLRMARCAGPLAAFRIAARNSRLVGAETCFQRGGQMRHGCLHPQPRRLPSQP